MMNKILVIFIINSFLACTALAQDGNLFSGEAAGDNETTYDDYTTIFGDSSLTDLKAYNSVFGALSAKFEYTATKNTLIGYKAFSQLYSSTSIGIGVSVGHGLPEGDGILEDADAYHSFLLGNKAAYSLGTGGASSSVLIGHNAGYSSSDITNSVFIGHNAGYGVTSESGGENVFIGHNTGYHNTDGEGNIAIGNYAEGYGSGASGYYLTSGEANTLMGASAGSSLTTANYNVFVGVGAGAMVEIGGENTFFGGLAGYNTNANGAVDSALQNVYIGYKAGYTNETGYRNLLMGYNADVGATRYNQSTGIGANTSINGHGAILMGYGSNASDDYVIAFGNEITANGANSIGSGYQTTITSDGDFSISLGYQSNMSSDSSIGIGYLVNIDNTEAIGIGANVAISGDNSVALGANNIINSENAFALGNDISITSDNQINIGNDDIMSISGIVNWTTTSDGRLKTKVLEDIPGLGFIMKLRPVTYQLLTSCELPVTCFGLATAISQPTTDTPQLATYNRFTGFIAQEIEATAQSIGYDFSGIDAPNSPDGRYGLRYAQFTIPLVKAVQELHLQSSQTTNSVQMSKDKIEKIDALLEEIKQEVETLEFK